LDVALVRVEAEEFLPRLGVPDLELLVAPDRGEAPSVRAIREAVDHEAVAEQASYLLAGRRVPDAERQVLACGREPSAVRAIDDVEDHIRMPGEGRVGTPGLDVPGPGHVASGRRELAAVGTEGDRANPPLRARDRAQPAEGGRIPDHDLIIVGVSLPSARGE